MSKFLDKLFKKEQHKLEKKGYLLVVTYETSEHATINHVFNREEKKFIRKKIFAANTIGSECYFSDINEMIDEINNHREYKRFLAGTNVTTILYVESTVALVDGMYVNKTTSVPFFYVPSKLRLEVNESKMNKN